MGVLIHLPSSEDYRYTHLPESLSPRLYTPPSSSLLPSPSPTVPTLSSPEDNKGSVFEAFSHSRSECECKETLENTALSGDCSPLAVEDAAVPRSDTPFRKRRTRVWSRTALRGYMLSHSVVGDKSFIMAKSRTPFVGEISNFVSPVDKEVTFGIKRLNNRDVESYRDKNSVVRFISDEGDGSKFVQEKDYPMGTMRTDTVVLGLADWNIVDENNVPVRISRKAILDLLHPDELDAIYERVLEVNPILTGREAQKND